METSAAQILFVGTTETHSVFVNVCDDYRRCDIEFVDSSDRAAQALRSPSRYDALVIDSAIPGCDVWHLASIVRSGRFGPDDIPIFLIRESDTESVPLLLCRDRAVALIQLDLIHRIPQIIISSASLDTRPTLLIIEDDAGAAEIAQCSLESAYAVTNEATGRDGLNAWQGKRHDIVVLDLKLPDLVGQSILESIASADPHQAVVIVTAYSQLDNHQDLVLNGASEFVAKPYRTDALNKACRLAHNQSICLRAIHQQERQRDQLSRSLWAANYCLEAGDIAHAKQQLNAVLDHLPVPSDDERVSISNCLFLEHANECF